MIILFFYIFKQAEMLHANNHFLVVLQGLEVVSMLQQAQPVP